MKNILVIAYFFPPFSDSGVFRIVKFVKYMPFFSYRPHVVCARDPYALNEDKSLLGEIPQDVKVHRVGSLIPMKGFRRMRSSFAGSSAGTNSRTKQQIKSKAGRILRAMFRKMFVDMMVPDMMLPWAPCAYREGKELCQREQVDVIYVTDPPSDYLAASMLSRRFRIPLVVELRDSWTLRHYGSQRKSVLRKKIEDKLEGWVFHCAAKVIFISPLMMQRYADKYPELASKFCVIPNGFDHEDFQGEISCPADIPDFQLLHAGRISEFRDPRGFFQALRELRDEGAMVSGRFHISFVGDFSVLYKQDIPRFGLEDMIHVIPHKPHHEIVKDMKKASALLLISGDDAEITTGKIYEYLGANRPILALAPTEGEVAKIIHDTRGGVVVHHNNVPDIKHALIRILKMGHQKDWTNYRDHVQRYSRKELTQALCEIFHSITP